jgi:hypothetical protein
MQVRRSTFTPLPQPLFDRFERRQTAGQRAAAAAAAATAAAPPSLSVIVSLRRIARTLLGRRS